MKLKFLITGYIFSIIFSIFLTAIPNSASSQEHMQKCDGILYAPLANTSVKIDYQKNSDFYKHALCKTNENEFNSYLHTDNSEYRKYCHMGYQELREASEKNLKLKGHIIGLGGADNQGFITKKGHSIFYNQSCDEFARRQIHTTNEYRKFFNNYCSDLTQKQHREAFQYYAQKLTNISARIDAWNRCITQTESKLTPALRCWISPTDDDDSTVTLNIYWWNIRKETALIRRFELHGAKFEETTVIPGIDFAQGFVKGTEFGNGKLLGFTQQIKSKKQRLPLGAMNWGLKRTSIKDDLKVRLNIMYSDVNISCETGLPAKRSVVKKLPQRKKQPTVPTDVSCCYKYYTPVCKKVPYGFVGGYRLSFFDKSRVSTNNRNLFQSDGCGPHKKCTPEYLEKLNKSGKNMPLPPYPNPQCTDWQKELLEPYRFN